ncbi:Fe(3+)-hydroxamate ABC transporter permease FhuB [Thalassobaculum salexigens]|uniref:Fe(3+)-hydroxamate ABC transporter permease FhuB n=1 Tax=Thalassobaculum salexigens TaxID=455360 RepID=UPI00248D9396|nr:Fe(3+)-hydroxamate ABC transporter permease FhuB [Thalassobaculum salexigens]
MPDTLGRSALWLAAMAVLAACLTAVNLAPGLASLGLDRLLAPVPSDVEAMVMAYSRLPRLCIGLLCGAALGLSGTLFQQVMRNPLASPSTIGVEAGAGFALAAATLYLPGLLGWSRGLVALTGGFAAVALVLLIAGRFRFAPLAVVLGGLVVGFYLSAATTTLALLHEYRLAGLFVWGSGSLSQQDWRPALELLPRLALAALAAALLARPLVLLQLDEAARGLGLRIALVRAGALAVAVALAGFTVSAVGVIGFLGLAAPSIARAIGARRLASRMVVAPLVGALLLTVTDQALQILTAATGMFLPTGAVTAMLGAPALFLLATRLRAAEPQHGARALVLTRVSSTWLVALLAALTVLALASLVLGRDLGGAWVADLGAGLEPFLAWRLPRMVGALAAGALLAVAGVMLQRLTRNPMASPEVLGVSAGSAFGLMVAVFTMSAPGQVALTACAAVGAAATLGVLLLGVRRRGLGGNQALLTGVAVAAFLMALLSAVTATGDPRALLLMGWMAGSTYRVDAAGATVAAVLALAMLPALPALARQLEHLSLGMPHARALGIPAERSALLVLCGAGLLTAAATLIVGPLSFVGLMAPHIAKRLGFARCLPQLAAAALLGAGVMVTADLLGRTVHFPWQIPAGLLSALIGAPILLVLLLRPQRRRARQSAREPIRA